MSVEINHVLKIKLSFILLFCYFTFTDSFNIEEQIPLVKEGPKRSLFGLSVAQHYISVDPINTKNIVLLVGAPLANDSISRSGGALFKCGITTERSCEHVLIDNSPSTIERDSSNQWLGVSLESQKPGGKVAVCGHRFTIRGTNPTKGVVWEQVSGQCYVMDSNMTEKSIQIHAPCNDRSDNDGSYSQAFYGYCQTGISSAFAQNAQEDFVSGTPGIFRWTGGFATKLLEPIDFLQDEILWSQKKRYEKISQNSYSGYSIDVGNVSHFSFVSGAPRAFDNGAVIIYKKNITLEINLQISEILIGDKFASSFGYSVKVFDITGDGYDDLIVGAPQYFDKEQNRGGAVYVYVNKRLDQIGPNATTILFGELDSFFGISIANLGDINMDGVNDFAVGAPSSDDGIGKVYIYHGSSDPNIGVISKPTQVLKGISLFNSINTNVSGFGYSLSGNLDMDLNGYPDLSVGSLSDIVVLFRTRPIVNVIAFVNASTDKVDIDASTPGNRHVVNVYDSQTSVVSFNISICMQYTSIPRTFNKKINISFTIELDKIRIENSLLSRVSFVPLSHDNKTMSGEMELYKQSDDQFKCVTYPVYLDKNIQDKLLPFVVSFTYDVVIAEIPPQSHNSLISLNNFPILNKNIPNVNYTQINISKNCGIDEICRSNLVMTAEYVVLVGNKWERLQKTFNGMPLLQVGTEKGIGIKVDITNKRPGEDAHQAKLKIKLPQVFDYTEFVPETPLSKTISCKKTSQNETALVTCRLGNPFRTNSVHSLILKFEKKQDILNISKVVVHMTVSTSSKQSGLDFKPYPLALQFQADLNIEGYSIDQQMRFSGKVIGESAVNTFSEVGLKVIHSYEVKNRGTIQVDQVFVTINWPYAISNGKWLFYLLSANVTGLNSTDHSFCKIPSNYLDPLKIDKANQFSTSRLKRDANPSEKIPDAKDISKQEQSSNVILKCPQTAECVTFNCSIGSIKSKSTVYIYVNALVWNSTFLEEYNKTTLVKVYSSAAVSVGLGNVVYSDSSQRFAHVYTTMLSENVLSVKEPVDIRIIIVSTFAGITLLILIVLLMWKCGFFKRRRDFGDYHKAYKHQQASKKADELSDKLVY